MKTVRQLQGSAGASPAVFGASPKTTTVQTSVYPSRIQIVSGKAHDTAGEPPALPIKIRLTNHYDL